MSPWTSFQPYPSSKGAEVSWLWSTATASMQPSSPHQPIAKRIHWLLLDETLQVVRTDLKFLTSFYPQIDGQTEHINSLVEMYLRHYVSTHQRDWVKVLDVAQFSYNLQQSKATGKSQFEIIMRFQPMMPNAILREKAQRLISSPVNGMRKQT